MRGWLLIAALVAGSAFAQTRAEGVEVKKSRLLLLPASTIMLPLHDPERRQ